MRNNSELNDVPLDKNFPGTARKIVLLLLVVAIGWYLSKTYSPRLLNDFPAYYDAGRAVLDGRIGDLYLSKSTFTNLPVLSLFCVPPAMFGYSTAWHILWWICIVAFASTLLLLVKTAQSRMPSDAGAALLPALIFLAYAPLMYRCLDLGQTTPLAVLLLAICIFLLLRKQNIGAGIALGALCALKIPPLLLLVVFAARRRWTTVATSVAVLLLAVLASWLWVGTEIMSQYAERIFGANTHGGLAVFNNQSLDGLWMRAFSSAGLTDWTPSPRPQAAVVALFLSLLAVSMGVVFAGWRFFNVAPASIKRTGDPETVELEVILAAALMVLVLPVTWTNYFLFLSVPFALFPIWWRRSNLPYYRIATAVLIVGVLLTAWPHVHENEYYFARETLFSLRLILAGRTVGALLLLGLCLAGMKLWTKSRTKEATPGQSD
ncbi:glycosyltransferase family 87 protein [Chlorobaculum sp. 24CR]|uniref:glycosyltransferase family 87 protein n=1 Tax=Chlorobaculum sp. 24CR TaxID=2508878 RepID=UPI00143222A8|nr:glycosyltransferase family 87 protein [Chlorobaculum sp. 24CR]